MTKVTRTKQQSETLVTPKLIEEIRSALKNIRGWGSVEIYVQKGRVTQITERNIKKTDQDLTEQLSR